MTALGYVLSLMLMIQMGSCTLTDEELSMIDSFMEEIIECRGMPGASISLVRDFSVELARGYGYANMESGEPYTALSKFGIASVSKHMTGTLAAKLMQNATQLDWDTVARDVLGEDFHFIDGFRSNNTNLRDLMSHDTGISGYDTLWILDSLDDRDQLVMEKFRFMKERHGIRQEFNYLTNSYSIVGSVLEEYFGASWEDLLQDQLFDQLGMRDSTFYDRAAPDYEGFITPYNYNISSDEPDVLQPSPFDLWTGAALVGPGCSVVSSAADMATWMQFVLSGGVTAGGERLIDEEDIQRLWYPESAYYDSYPGTPEEEVTDSRGNYGLGWTNGHYRGYKAHSHGGDLNGFHGEIFLMSDLGIGSYFATNFGGHSGERVYVHRFMADVLLGVEPAYNATDICRMFDEESAQYHRQFLSNKDYKKLNELLDDNEVNILSSLGVLDDAVRHINDHDSEIFKISKSESVRVHDSKLLLKHENNLPARPIERYEGQYGDFVHGNLTVALSTMCSGCLYMEYGTKGLYTLYPTNVSDFFIGYNIYPLYDWTPVTFLEQDEDGNALFVRPSFWEWTYPPYFERGLLMSDAPPPRNDICGPSL